ncbi:MAG: putative polymerase subfamily sigma factor [Ilumatobacteraceae bacterium]|nr:putative polymerase subfamily sigma factor [Ilumatobacteraceae bacterium]
MTSSSPADDADLVRRARAGDTAAFGSIVRTYQGPALRLATVICGDPTEAYDIVQEAFVSAHSALPTIRTDESLRPWLMRIVANHAKNSRRSRWRRDARTEHQARLRIDDAIGADAPALDAIAAAALLRAVQRLPHNDRSVIACRYFAGMSEAETAAALGVANGTVKSRTARALARLRANMPPEELVS